MCHTGEDGVLIGDFVDGGCQQFTQALFVQQPVGDGGDVSLMLLEPLNELFLGDDLVSFEERLQRVGNLVAGLTQQVGHVVPP